MRSVEKIKDDLYSTYRQYVEEYTTKIEELGFDTSDEDVISHAQSVVLSWIEELAEGIPDLIDDVTFEQVEDML